MKTFKDIRALQSDTKKRDRDPRRRPLDRRDDGSLRETDAWHSRHSVRPRPSLRQLVQVDRSQLWKGAPIKMLAEGKTKSGGRNNYGRITTRHIGGGHKQAYRLVDFRRRKHDVAGEGRAAGVRSQPHRVHRPASSTRTGRTPTSWRRSGWASATGRLRREGRREARQRHAARLHADRHHRPQHRAEARRRRQDRALGRRLRAAGRPRRGLGGAEASTRARRGACAPSAWRPSARCRTPITSNEVDRQGRPHALEAARVRPCARSP